MSTTPQMGDAADPAPHPAQDRPQAARTSGNAGSAPSRQHQAQTPPPPPQMGGALFNDWASI